MEKIIMENIIKGIESRSSEIIQSIARESIDVYNYLSSQLRQTNVTADYFYQFVYRSFFRLDNAGLTDNFKVKYFDFLEEFKNKKEFDYHEILSQLYEIKNKKNQCCFQFSFVTKMHNIIQNDRPIFDANVVDVLKLKFPSKKLFDEKFKIHMQLLLEIESFYSKTVNDNLLPITLSVFDTKFSDNKLSLNKKIDFILWSAGKKVKTKN
jgi:hypothetical protein